MRLSNLFMLYERYPLPTKASKENAADVRATELELYIK
jgi:hypothetical protein